MYFNVCMTMYDFSWLLPKTFPPHAGPTQPCEGPQAASKGYVKEEREPNSDYKWKMTMMTMYAWPCMFCNVCMTIYVQQCVLEWPCMYGHVCIARYI